MNSISHCTHCVLVLGVETAFEGQSPTGAARVWKWRQRMWFQVPKQSVPSITNGGSDAL